MLLFPSFSSHSENNEEVQLLSMMELYAHKLKKHMKLQNEFCLLCLTVEMTTVIICEGVFVLFLLKYKCNTKYFQPLIKILHIIKWAKWLSWQSFTRASFFWKNSKQLFSPCMAEFHNKERKSSLSKSLLFNISCKLCGTLYSLGQFVGGKVHFSHFYCIA